MGLLNDIAYVIVDIIIRVVCFGMFVYGWIRTQSFIGGVVYAVGFFCICAIILSLIYDPKQIDWGVAIWTIIIAVLLFGGVSISKEEKKEKAISNWIDYWSKK